jgi:hypothetical protein
MWQTIQAHVLEVLAGIGVSILGAMGLMLRSFLKDVKEALPKLIMGIGDAMVANAAKTEDKGDDLVAKVAQVVTRIIADALKAVLGTRALDAALRPTPSGATVVVEGKAQVDRRASLPAEVVASEVRVVCGKQVAGGTGRCTQLPGHAPPCASTPMTQAVFPHHTPK